MNTAVLDQYMPPIRPMLFFELWLNDELKYISGQAKIWWMIGEIPCV